MKRRRRKESLRSASYYESPKTPEVPSVLYLINTALPKSGFLHVLALELPRLSNDKVTIK